MVTVALLLETKWIGCQQSQDQGQIDLDQINERVVPHVTMGRQFPTIISVWRFQFGDKKLSIITLLGGQK